MGDSGIQVGLSGDGGVTAALVEAHGLLLGGEDDRDSSTVIPGRRSPPSRVLKRGDHPGPQAGAAAGASHGQPSQVDHTRGR